jgi:hypothetical protein
MHSLISLFSMLESAKHRDELYQMSRQGQESMNQIEQSSKPIVAAIAGSCLGGGFEVRFVFFFFFYSLISLPFDICSFSLL